MLNLAICEDNGMEARKLAEELSKTKFDFLISCRTAAAYFLSSTGSDGFHGICLVV